MFELLLEKCRNYSAANKFCPLSRRSALTYQEVGNPIFEIYSVLNKMLNNTIQTLNHINERETTVRIPFWLGAAKKLLFLWVAERRMPTKQFLCSFVRRQAFLKRLTRVKKGWYSTDGVPLYCDMQSTYALLGTILLKDVLTSRLQMQFEYPLAQINLQRTIILSVEFFRVYGMTKYFCNLSRKKPYGKFQRRYFPPRV